jgi:hypothetical protein
MKYVLEIPENQGKLYLDLEILSSLVLQKWLLGWSKLYAGIRIAALDLK